MKTSLSHDFATPLPRCTRLDRISGRASLVTRLMMMYYYLLIAGAHGRHGKRNSLSLAPAHDHPAAICVHRPPSKLDSADLKAQSCLMSRPDLLSTTSKSNRAQYLPGLTEPHSPCPSPSKNICGYCPSYTCPLPIIFYGHHHPSSSSNSMSRYKQEQLPRERRSIHHSPPTATPWQRFSEEKSPPTYLHTLVSE